MALQGSRYETAQRRAAPSRQPSADPNAPRIQSLVGAVGRGIKKGDLATANKLLDDLEAHRQARLSPTEADPTPPGVDENDKETQETETEEPEPRRRPLPRGRWILSWAKSC